MRCFSCDSGVMHPQNVTVTGEIRDEKYTFDTPGMMCDSCQVVAYEGKDVSEQQRRLADAYRHAHGLLTSVEIKLLREKLDMSQIKFAAYLKVGVASIKRWELGAIQDEANDCYLRLKTDLATAEANCAEISQIANDMLRCGEVGQASDDQRPKLILRIADEERMVSLPASICPFTTSQSADAAATQFAYAA